MSKVKHLVLRAGYVESSDNAVLIISREDLSEFDPEEAGAELFELIKTSCEYGYHRWLTADDDEYTAGELAYEAYWGTADSTGWHWEAMNGSGWTYYKFPDSVSNCHFVEEKAEVWLFDCWEKKNPDWQEQLEAEEKKDLKKSALGKLSRAEKKALGLE